MVSTAMDQQVAPSALEEVRTLLNTWRIPNDTRVPVDELDELDELDETGDENDELRVLRDDVRAVVEGASDADRTLTAWIDRLGVTAIVDGGRVRFRHDAGRLGDLLAIVLDAVVDGTWKRLKACPDCRWVFYDNTRNGSKRWCLMTAAGPGSRGCGNIAKVRRHRERARRP